MQDYFVPYENLAVKKGLVFGNSSQTDLLWGSGMSNSKFCFLQKGDELFWAFDSYATKFGMKETYSGLYRWVKLPESGFQCRMTMRFFLDLLVEGKRDKLDIPAIDRKVTLHTNDKEYAKQIITLNLVEKYLNLPKGVLPAELVINADYIPGFKGHEGQQLVGLETKRWYSADELEQYWEVLEEFIQQIL